VGKGQHPGAIRRAMQSDPPGIWLRLLEAVDEFREAVTFGCHGFLGSILMKFAQMDP